MKKYIKPELNVTIIQLQAIVAASAPGIGIDTLAGEIEAGSVDAKHRDDDDFDFGGEGGDWSDDLW